MRLLRIVAVIALAAPAAAETAFPQKRGSRPASGLDAEAARLASGAPDDGAIPPAPGASPLAAAKDRADRGHSRAAPAASDLLRGTQKIRRN